MLKTLTIETKAVSDEYLHELYIKRVYRNIEEASIPKIIKEYVDCASYDVMNITIE